jgi:hypothetical protein
VPIPSPHYNISIQLSEFIYLDAWLSAIALIMLLKLLIIVLVEVTCRYSSVFGHVSQLAYHQYQTMYSKNSYSTINTVELYFSLSY